jgi:hypothetical protein
MRQALLKTKKDWLSEEMPELPVNLLQKDLFFLP